MAQRDSEALPEDIGSELEAIQEKLRELKRELAARKSVHDDHLEPPDEAAARATLADDG